MPTPTIPAGNLFMDVLLWSGTGGSSGATRTLTGLNFQPDFTWEKDRLSGQDHHLFDSVRGAGLNKTLASNSTGAEGGFNDTLYGYLSSFNSNGVTTTNGSSTWDNWNKSGDTYVAWNWKANGTAVTNTDGTITSQVSANTTSGFSVVTYTGTGSNATVGHGLGVAPKMIIVKNRVDGGPNWYCYHASLPSASYTLYLNLTNAQDSATAFWNNTAPTSSVFSVGTSSGVNGSTNGMVAYCWAEIAGFSKFGSYTGNGSTDGPFVYTGFRPKFVMVKCSSNSTGSTVWSIFDTSRSPYNAAVLELYPNLSSAEGTDASGMDILSNGFKPKRNSEYLNSSGWTYIYMAIAENPFKYANAR